MAKAKYKQNSSGKWETKVWDGTYNPDGSKHRKKISSAKSSADLERKVNQLRNEVENGSYVQKTDITFLEYARLWLTTKKSVREKNTRKMYENIIETHLSFLDGVALCDIRNSHFQLAITRANFTDREKAFVYIIYSCGLRRGEALALSKFDFKTVDGK